MSNFLCPYPSSELKMANRILNYPPNRSLSTGRQWKSIFGVFAVEEDLACAVKSVAVDNVRKDAFATAVLKCSNHLDVLRKTVYCCALGMQGLPSAFFSLEQSLPQTTFRIVDQKALLEVRELFLIRLLLNAAVECFLQSDDAVLSAYGSAMRRIVDLTDYAVATTASKLMTKCLEKEMSLFEFWSNCSSESTSLRVLFQAIAPVPLFLASQSKSFCQYTLHANSVIDEYFYPSGWSGFTSSHHKWSLFNRLLHQYSTTRKVYWSGSRTSSLSSDSIFLSTNRHQQFKLSRNFISMVVHGHLLKSIAEPLLQPLAKHLYLLQQLEGAIGADESDILCGLDTIELQNSVALLSVDDVFTCIDDSGSLEGLTSAVFAWSNLRVVSLLHAPISDDIRAMIRKVRHVVHDNSECSGDGDVAMRPLNSSLLHIPTSDAEVAHLTRLLAYSTETVDYFSTVVTNLLIHWVAVESLHDENESSKNTISSGGSQNEVKSGNKGVISVGTSDLRSFNRKAHSASILDDHQPSSLNMGVSTASATQAATAAAISAKASVNEIVEVPLIVGSSAAVDHPVELDRAMQELRQAYAMKFLKVDTQRALFKWRTIRSQTMRASRAALRYVLQSEEEQLLQLKYLKEEQPMLFQQRLDQAMQEDRKRVVLLQLHMTRRMPQTVLKSRSEEVTESQQEELQLTKAKNVEENFSSGDIISSKQVDTEVEQVISVSDEEEKSIESEKNDNQLLEDSAVVGVTSEPVTSEGSDPAAIELTTELVAEFQPPTLVSSAFLDVSKSLLQPDLSWIASEEELLRETLSDYSQSMRLLALHSKLVEGSDDLELDTTLKPGGESAFSAGLVASEGLLIKCIRAQCNVLNIVSLHSAISVSGVLDQLKAMENFCLFSPQSDFISRLCSHMMESCAALGVAQIQSRRLASVWNNETLSSSFTACLEAQQEELTQQWSSISIVFELAEDVTSESTNCQSAKQIRVIDNHQLPVQLCAADGVTRLRLVRRTGDVKPAERSSVVSCLVFSDAVLDGISSMTIRCLEVCQLQELLRMVWLKMKNDRQQQLPIEPASRGRNNLRSYSRGASRLTLGGVSLVEYRSGLLLVQHLVRGVAAYLSERIIAARAVLRQRLLNSVHGGGLESLVLAVRGFADSLCESALLEDPRSGGDQFSDDWKCVCGDLSLLLRGCRVLLVHLLCDDIAIFNTVYADLQARLTSLHESISNCSGVALSHLNSLLLYVQI